jgi:hypothetical protein
MKRFQYRVAYVVLQENMLWLLGQGPQYNEQHPIDRLGSEGWELVQIVMTDAVRSGSYHIAIFKRESPEPAQEGA